MLTSEQIRRDQKRRKAKQKGGPDLPDEEGDAPARAPCPGGDRGDDREADDEEPVW